jgi:Lrp/AsnC family transcriptional regulator, leucine-responsive regulatory protein
MNSKSVSDPILDTTDWRILQALQKDARISMTALAKKAHLSAPAVTERVKRLEERGVITGYRAQLSPLALGYGITALIRINAQFADPIAKAVNAMPEIIECMTVTGRECMELRAIVRDVAHLEKLLLSLKEFGETSTAIVLRIEKPASEIKRPAA